MTIKLGYLDDITNYNVLKDSCCHRTCDTKATQFASISIGEDFTMLVALCDKHAEEYFFARLKEKTQESCEPSEASEAL